jgi:NAD(P)-dependent dehydrogenase (short-subunit alcohol dehydrogenase family)
MLSSAGHAGAPAGGIDYRSVVSSGRELAKWAEYGQAKWGDIALAKYLHLTHREILSFSMHPGEYAPVHAETGMVATNLASHLSLTAFILNYMPFLIVSPDRPR